MFSRVLKMDSGNALAYCHRGNVYFDTGDMDRAVADYKRAIARKPDFATAYVRRAALYPRHEVAKAIRDFDEAIRLRPNNSEAYYGRALRYMEVDEDRAIQDFRQAIRYDPKHVYARFHLAKLLESRGDHQEALTQFSRVISLKPHLSEALRRRGAIYLALGKKGESAADLRKANELEHATH